MSVTRGREAAFFFSNYRIRVLRFLYGTLLSAYIRAAVLSTDFRAIYNDNFSIDEAPSFNDKR